MISRTKLDLAAMAFVEQQILSDAAKTGELAPSTRRQEVRYQVRNGSFGSGVFPYVRLMSLMYCLFVVPREIWLTKDVSLRDRIDGLFALDGIRVLEQPKGRMPTISEFLRHIRNAVSHANFDFVPDYVEFWDGPNPAQPSNFRVQLSMLQLEELLSEVGGFLANLRNEVPQVHTIQ